jgi:hypothetical protein
MKRPIKFNLKNADLKSNPREKFANFPHLAAKRFQKCSTEKLIAFLINNK